MADDKTDSREESTDYAGMPKAEIPLADLVSYLIEQRFRTRQKVIIASISAAIGIMGTLGFGNIFFKGEIENFNKLEDTYMQKLDAATQQFKLAKDQWDSFKSEMDTSRIKFAQIREDMKKSAFETEIQSKRVLTKVEGIDSIIAINEKKLSEAEARANTLLKSSVQTFEKRCSDIEKSAAERLKSLGEFSSTVTDVRHIKRRLRTIDPAYYLFVEKERATRMSLLADVGEIELLHTYNKKAKAHKINVFLNGEPIDTLTFSKPTELIDPRRINTIGFTLQHHFSYEEERRRGKKFVVFKLSYSD